MSETMHNYLSYIYAKEVESFTELIIIYTTKPL